MRSLSPDESCHVLSSEALRNSGARILALRQEAGDVVAVGALKPLGATAVELKSMHVCAERRGQGLGAHLLNALLDEARRLGAASAWLETGAEPVFAAARALYKSAGFSDCPPFGPYRHDPLSVFMTRRL